MKITFTRTRNARRSRLARSERPPPRYPHLALVRRRECGAADCSRRQETGSGAPRRRPADLAYFDLEIGVQHAKGSIQLSAPLRDWVQDALAPVGITLLPLDAESAAE